MKKTIAFLLAMVMLLGVLTGCGNSGAAEPAQTEAPAAEAAQPEAPATAAAQPAEP